MRICIITGIFPPDIGGPATYVRHLAQSLCQNGHDVCVITQGDDRQARFSFAVRRISRKYPLPLRLILLLISFMRYGWQSDVWYINGLELPAVLAGRLLRKRMAMKVVGDYPWERAMNKRLTADSIDDFQRKRQLRSVELHKTLRAWYTRQVHKVITPSRYLKGIVCGWGVPEDRVQVIYNAVEAIPEIPATRTEARKQLGLHETDQILATVGRLVPWKGNDLLIQAIAQMKTQVWLLIIGDGPEKGRLVELSQQLGVAQRVTFVGKVDRRRALCYVKAADIFVLNSTYEGLPHVVLEAMSVGTPVVAAAAGGTPEVVRDDETGRLIPLSDVSALQQALSELLASHEKRKRFVAGSRAALEAFHFSRMLQETERSLAALQPQ